MRPASSAPSSITIAGVVRSPTIRAVAASVILRAAWTWPRTLPVIATAAAQIVASMRADSLITMLCSQWISPFTRPSRRSGSLLRISPSKALDASEGADAARPRRCGREGCRGCRFRRLRCGLTRRNRLLRSSLGSRDRVARHLGLLLHASGPRAAQSVSAITLSLEGRGRREPSRHTTRRGGDDHARWNDAAPTGCTRRTARRSRLVRNARRAVRWRGGQRVSDRRRAVRGRPRTWSRPGIRGRRDVGSARRLRAFARRVLRHRSRQHQRGSA